jgi:suppressor for copper-sensitivity B
MLAISRLLLLTIVLALSPRLAFALAGDWDVNDHVDTRLVAAVDGVGDATKIQLGLQFKMKKGWKIYWRSPGESGLPPSADWSSAKNFQDAKMSWPAPSRFTIFGLETFGYKDEVVFPISAVVTEPGKPVQIRAALRYLTCNDICVPYDVSLALDLPEGPATAGREADLIAKYVKLTPGDGNGLSIEQAVLSLRDKAVVLSAEAKSLSRFSAPDLFVEGAENAVFGRPKVTFADQGRRAFIEVAALGATAADFKNAELTLTLVDEGRALETGTPAMFGEFQAPELATAPISWDSIWKIVALAVLGGLILNLMPCVLPVLSIKLLSIANHGGGDKGHIRISFFASAAGVITSLLAIGGALVALKSAGMSVGWGIQFQQPVFLTIMAVVVVLFAYNLWGLFEVQLPQSISGFAAERGQGNSIGGHFMTGAFATLLATPCSAPFVGSAIGFALSRGAAEIFLIFGALGFGLALPYIIVGLFPGAVARLPRPGNWMNSLRRILALALGVTALWLLSVLFSQIGADDALSVAALLALIGVVLVLRRLPGSRLGRHAGAVSAILIATAIAIPALGDRNSIQSASNGKEVFDGPWTPFDVAAIDRHVKAGKLVFVDVTADWCITCKVNKKIVLDADPVATFLTQENVVAMRADWTLPNAEIAAYLESFGRYGIPFNAIYGTNAPKGRALPELLSASVVMDVAKDVGRSAFVEKQK